jgi:hypothetical protein
VLTVAAVVIGVALAGAAGVLVAGRAGSLQVALGDQA